MMYYHVRINNNPIPALLAAITIFNYEASKLAVDQSKIELHQLRSALSPTLRYYTGLDGDDDGRPEEDAVLAMLVAQIEMEAALTDEYDKIVSATKAQAFDLQTFTLEFQAQQTLGMWTLYHLITYSVRIIIYHTLYHHIPYSCLLYTSPSPRDRTRSRMPSSA